MGGADAATTRVFDAAGRLAGRLVAGTACGAACSSSIGEARATAEYSRPVCPRFRKAAGKRPHAAAAQQTGFACVLHLGRLCWTSEQHGKELSCARARLVGAVPEGCRGRIAAGDGRALARWGEHRVTVASAEGRPCIWRAPPSPHPTWCTLWSRL